MESHYPVRVCADHRSTELTTVLFRVAGRALGFTPVVVCGLATAAMAAAGRGLWTKSAGEPRFTRLTQATVDATDYWQANYDPSTGLYEVV